MATPYEDIYSRFLSKITDYDLPNIPDDELESMLCGWLTSAISKFRKCESDLSQRDDELRTFLVDLVDEEKEILSILMTIEWLQPQITSGLVTRQMFSGKEEKLWQYTVNSSLCLETA